MEDIKFEQPTIFLLTFFFTFLGIFFRYVLLALLLDTLFNGVFKKEFLPKKVSLRTRNKATLRKEIIWSGVTSLIFAFSAVLLVVCWQRGLTKVYADFSDYPLWYLPISTLLFLLVHETYYYWLHRWMHKPKVFKIVHKVHHESVTPSVWTAFSFHPLEGILQALVLPVFLFFIPLHYSVIGFLLLFMTISSFVNHLNIEIYSSSFLKNKFGKWLIGATHHTLHHTEFKTNYGLYFTFWDNWMGTESPNYTKMIQRLFKLKKKNKDEMEKKVA